MTERPLLRAARAGVFTSVCAAVSVGGHSLSSGHVVPAGGLLAGSALVYALAWAVTGRERGLGVITGWMAWAQLALHMVYAISQSSAAHSGHAPDPAALETASGGADMLAVHVVAGVVCAWWLRQGEAALFTYLRLVAAALLPFLVLGGARPLPPRLSPPRPCSPARRHPTAPYLRHSLVLRGPPKHV